MKKLIVLSVSLLFAFAAFSAPADTTKNGKSEKDSVTAYDKLFKEKHEKAEGMFTLHKVKEKVYFEIPLEMMGRDMLIASTVTETSNNANGIVGAKPNPLHITFSKTGERVQLRRMHTGVITDNESSNIADAIKRSSIGSVMESMKIEAYNSDSSAVVVDMTSYFVGDNKELTPFDMYSQYTMFNGLKRTETFQQDKSFLEEIKAFSDNVVVKSTLSYNYSLTDQRTNKMLLKDAPFTAVVSRSIVLLKDEPARPRHADYRVAIFHTGKQLFGEKEQTSRNFYYANRWNLVPKDKAAYKVGKLTEPVEPIVFYIDNNFPEQWKPHIIEGVEQWGELFEEIGFKNAIKAVEFPLDDPEFDPDNVKYSCVRYAPIGIQNAMGPSWVDPRSGEIINASVYIYHDMIKLLNNWMFVQISPANPRIRNKNLPDDIIMDGLRYVTAHEVGHTLGFMHNMSSSNSIPVDSLRSPTYTNETGTTNSIMDYARFNYVAQPGDYERGVKLTPPRFGEYDRFMIKWNYMYFPETETAKEEAKILSDMVSEAIKDPVYQYGKQLSYPLDPRSQTEDLGDDAIKASEYGIKNLKYLISNMNSWVAEDDPDFSYRTNIYENIVYQYIRYINHVFAYVGGVYLNEVKVTDDMVPFESVEKEKQKEALYFIMDQMDKLDWLNEPTLMNNMNLMGSPRNLMQMVLAEAIISAPRKVLLSASIADDPYDFFECSDDVYNFVWGPTERKENLTEIQRHMQDLYLKGVMANSGVNKLLVSIAANEPQHPVTMFDILEKNDVTGRFATQLQTQAAMEDVSGYGVPSTKFNMLFPPESDSYIYLMRVKDLLESRRRGRMSEKDRLHYDLMLRKINATLSVE
jgi:hypothetical protein